MQLMSKKENATQNSTPTEASAQKPKKKITSRQIAAIIGIVVLVLMYLVTLVAAVTDNSASANFFFASLLATIAVPLLIWIYVWMYGRLTGRSTMADPEPKNAGSSSPEEDN